MQATLLMLGVCFLAMTVHTGAAQAGPQSQAATRSFHPEQELITLSKDKWRWMAERNVEALDKLFAEQAVFVHMGATFSKAEELDTIKTGRIQYKDAQIQEVSVRFVGERGSCSTASDSSRSWGQRGRQPVQRHRGVREGGRSVEARLALVYQIDDPAGTVRATCTAVTAAMLLVCLAVCDVVKDEGR